MVVKIRCCECRRVVRAAPQAGERQKVCCPECRAARKRKQARRRRQRDLVGAKEDEVRRQRRHREKVRAAQSRPADPPLADGRDCHAPADSRKSPELRAKAAKIVDVLWRVSRPRLERELMRELLENKARQQQREAEIWQAGEGCHAPGEARSRGKNPAESVDSVDHRHAPG
ncbi:MAG: hypothetical protein HY901_09035 [Deltaproteobacteria bacterium]|nr:hypothetical protein [Deltaproteobacteria bacterium]